jgi:hypothetical protein
MPASKLERVRVLLKKKSIASTLSRSERMRDAHGSLALELQRDIDDGVDLVLGAETLLKAYPWLEADDIRACLLYARKVVSEERIETLVLETAA